jgi:hypothetical protein
LVKVITPQSPTVTYLPVAISVFIAEMLNGIAGGGTSFTFRAFATDAKGTGTFR